MNTKIDTKTITTAVRFEYCGRHNESLDDATANAIERSLSRLSQATLTDALEGYRIARADNGESQPGWATPSAQTGIDSPMPRCCARAVEAVDSRLSLTHRDTRRYVNGRDWQDSTTFIWAALDALN